MLFNEGKTYADEKIFSNDDVGIDEVLEGMSEGDAEYFKEELESGNGPYYSPSDPFITFDQGIKSIDMNDFVKMLSPEMVERVANDEVMLANLDDSDFQEAFAEFVKVNYPSYIKNWTSDWEEQYLYDFDFRYGDWNRLVKTLGVNTISLSESDLRRMANKILKEILKGKK